MRERDYSTEDRVELARQGKAIPVRDDRGEIIGGRYPIETRQDVEDAVNDADRSDAGSAERQHIIRNAERVGASEVIPGDWHRMTAGLKPRKPYKPAKSKPAKSKAPKAAKKPSKPKAARESTRFHVELREADVRKTGSACDATLIREGPGNPEDNPFSLSV